MAPPGLTVGGWFASAAISKLADLVRTYTSDQYEYQRGEKKKLESLQGSLIKVQAVIDAAERKGIEENSTLLGWLNQLKNASYDAEDVLDLFEYKTLEQEAEPSSQVRKSMKHAGNFVKRLFFADDDLNDLDNVVKKFDKLADDGLIGTFLKVVELHVNTVQHKQDEMPEWRHTTHNLIEPQIGRSREKARLLNLLGVSISSDHAYGSSSQKNYSVVSIVGIGGVGKTTLAQSVYNDPKVKRHFKVMVWFCVSKPFDLKRVVLGIIESARIKTPLDFHNYINLDRIQMLLNDGLKGKKFLIVLDDIWEDMDTDSWKKLCSTFQFGKEGSRIVVTTRNQNIAESLKSKESINLNCLEDDDFWKFFKCCAFGDEKPEDHSKLVFIGKRIVKKLGGLPLAAKTVGRLLESRMDEKHWRNVLESKLWQQKQEKDGILPSLRLSYVHLPAQLKPCFVYCSLFPKDYRFDKDKLIHYWMALGYVQPRQGKTLEDIGEEYFSELANRSFIQKEGDDYVMHDMLHDLAESISTEEIYRQENGKLVQLKIPERACHLNVSYRVLNQVCNSKRLRSLVINFDCNSVNDISRELKTIFTKLTGLRILIFDGRKWLTDIDIQTVLDQPIIQKLLDQSIGCMKHLRYLQLPRKIKCPDSCSKLYHLQVLVVLGDFSGKTFNKLINLRHMYWNFSPVGDTPSIGCLTSLQELHWPFFVKKEDRYKIGELRNLRQLRGSLKIRALENVKDEKEAGEAELDNKEHVEKLYLGWTENSDKMMRKADEEVLEGLQPHLNLKELEIYGYMGMKIPSWINKTDLESIECIELYRCSFVKVLPPLGELPFLKVLVLFKLHSLVSVGTEIYGEASTEAFPCLEKLVLSSLKALTEWSGVEDGRVLMPRLRVLEIHNCMKLKGPIPFHSSLRELKASHYKCEDGDISMLTDYIPANSLACLQSIDIGPMLKFKTLTDQQKKFQSLTSLKELIFHRCNHIQSLPNTLTSLSSLETLHIEWCDEIQGLPEDGLPPCLRELHIRTCYELGCSCDWRRQGSEWHKISHIPLITIDREVIPRPLAEPQNQERAYDHDHGPFDVLRYIVVENLDLLKKIAYLCAPLLCSFVFVGLKGWGLMSFN